MICTRFALRVYLTKHHKHCQIQIWTSIEKAKRATCTGNAGISATCCRLRAGLLHTLCCILHTACCWLFAAGCRPFVFNSQCCNSGRYVTYASCFLYLASVARRMLRAAYCVLQVACRLMYPHVLQYWTTRYIPLPVPCLWLLA